jgi:hypothetical protein
VERIIWDGDRFIASRSDKLYTSADGITWQEFSSNISDIVDNKGREFDVDISAYCGPDGGKKYFGHAWGSYGDFAYSTNLKDWIAIEDDVNPFRSNGSRGIRSITWGGPAGQEKYVACGEISILAYSTDGITWTSDDITWTGTAINDSGSFDGVVWDGKKFVMIHSSSGGFATSPDGVTWTKGTGSTGFTSMYSPTGNCFIYAGGKFVAGGSHGKIAWSVNGTSGWQEAVSTFGNRKVQSITFGGDRYVAVGAEGWIAYSTTE